MKQREIKFRTFGANGPMWYSKDANSLEHFFAIAEFNAMPIEQFTGLKDKNGRELWEGDIRGYSDGDDSVFVVEFRDGAFCANYGKDEDGYDVVPRIDRFHLEQSIHLGNIHENPELLKP